jgi:hypothetical protein
MQLGKPPLARLSNYSESIAGIPSEDMEVNTIVAPCGVYGQKLLMQKASASNAKQAQGALYVCKHHMTGGTGRQQTQGIFVPWIAVKYDTSERELFDPLYLVENGKISFDAPEGVARQVGQVLVVGGPGVGEILLKP